MRTYDLDFIQVKVCVRGFPLTPKATKFYEYLIRDIRMIFGISALVSIILIYALRLIYNFNEKKKLEFNSPQTVLIFWIVSTTILNIFGSIVIRIS